MACLSGNSSGSSGSPSLQNSGSEEDLQLLMDQRKRKRKESNRESARRSRQRKQKHLDDLMSQVSVLRMENNQILTNVNLTTQQCLNIESENSVLSAQVMELNQRLQSLNDIINNMNMNINNKGWLEAEDLQTFSESFINYNPWNLMSLNQPIMASADMFHC